MTRPSRAIRRTRPRARPVHSALAANRQPPLGARRRGRMGAGPYCPADIVTRDQIAKILVKALQLNGP